MADRVQIALDLGLPPGNRPKECLQVLLLGFIGRLVQEDPTPDILFLQCLLSRYQTVSVAESDELVVDLVVESLWKTFLYLLDAGWATQLDQDM